MGEYFFLFFFFAFGVLDNLLCISLIKSKLQRNVQLLQNSAKVSFYFLKQPTPLHICEGSCDSDGSLIGLKLSV